MSDKVQTKQKAPSQLEPHRPPAPAPEHRLAVKVLEYAERSGVSMGGLFLLVLGLYGGQYAALFPEATRVVAGVFCLIVSACGLITIVCQLFIGWQRKQLLEKIN